MRQLLMLGFYCEVYRREPRCRIYVNNVLVDEFNISHTPCKHPRIPDIGLDKAMILTDEFALNQSTPFLKYIEFDDYGGGSINLRVEIQNNDNNYNNGFMTRYTRVQLCQCWLASVKIWENFDQIQNRWKFNQHRWQKYHRVGSIISYQKKWRNVVFDNLAAYAEMCFPGINTEKNLSKIKQLESQCSNHEHLPRPSWQNSYPPAHWVGTSGHFYIDLSKKLGFWRHNTDRRRGWWKWKWAYNKDTKYLYNKYKQYEDQRSIDT